MPPKKKTTLPSKPQGGQPQSKEQQISPVEQKSSNIGPIKSDFIQKKIENKQKPKTEQIIENSSKIVPTIRVGLSQQQILKMRRQKFRNPSKIESNEDQKIREQRMKKFGAQPKQSKQQLQQRKKKFSNSAAILTEDQQILRQRRMKFSNNSAVITNQDPNILEQRKKKFAKNQQNLISLDDQIAKTKVKTKNKKQDRKKKFRVKDGKIRKFRHGKKNKNDQKRSHNKHSQRDRLKKKKIHKNFRKPFKK